VPRLQDEQAAGRPEGQVDDVGEASGIDLRGLAGHTAQGLGAADRERQAGELADVMRAVRAALLSTACLAILVPGVMRTSTRTGKTASVDTCPS